MAIVREPSFSRRRLLLMSTVQSVLLYRAEVWADDLNKEVYWMSITGSVRLRFECLVTVPDSAVLVIAESPRQAFETRSTHETSPTMAGKAGRRGGLLPYAVHHRSWLLQVVHALDVQSRFPGLLYWLGILDDAEKCFFRCALWESPHLEATSTWYILGGHGVWKNDGG
ncbi:hypothetical protein J6590_099798 [Homalodisca vitripennis]|nr:hypothetical protein J6590_087133 [Homalodisca vitripennis]KAG8279671.1 hypothetical protein J6590_099798 [Homalodisca vitripennis]